MKRVRIFLRVGATIGLGLLLVLIRFSTAEARIKLTALPDRDKVTIHLENPAATLIEEERILTLQKGENQIDFSWKGVSIDPDSIRLAIISHPKEVKLISVSFPPAESALVWQVYSPSAIEERVRISYLLSGIDRLVTYKAVAKKDETNLNLQSYLVLRNFSGEDFQQARLVLDYGADYTGPVLYEETKETLLFSKQTVPIKKVLTWDAAKAAWDPETQGKNVGIPVTYEIKNEPAAGLGKFGLWDGKFRIFQDDGHGSTIFLGEDTTGYTPVGKEAAVYIGDSRDIVVTQRKMQETMVNIRRNKGETVILYDSDDILKAKIENFKDVPQMLTMVQHIPGQWELVESTHRYELKDAGTLKFEVQLKPREKQEFMIHYIRRNIRPK